MSTDAPESTTPAATPATTPVANPEATPSMGKIARQKFEKFKANFNPAHTAANLLRKTGTLADKLPTPGEVARDVATRLDAIDPKAYEKRVQELKTLEQAVVSKFANGSGK